jgi:hypothetical protein
MPEALDNDAAYQQFAASVRPAAAAGDGGDDAAYQQFAASVKPKPEPDAATRPAAPHAAHAPTPAVHRGVARAPAGGPEPSWGDTFEQAGKNLIPSAGDVIGSTVSAFAHPVQTMESLGALGKGVASKAAGAIGMPQDPASKAENEKLLDALGEHYKQSYGSVAGFKKALGEDPASVLMDVTTPLSFGAGATGIAGKVGKVASMADPVNAAMSVAKTVAKPATIAVRGAQSAATGVPASLLKVAHAAGSSSDPALRDTFKRFYSGQGDASEFQQAAQDALRGVRQDASDAYLAKKGTLNQVNPDFNRIEQAIQDARSQTRAGGVNVGQFKHANDMLDEVEQMVDGWKHAPDRAYQSLMGMDNLKQAVWDLRDSTSNDVARRHMGSIYDATKKAIVDADPEYANLMESYQTGRNNLQNLQKTLGLGNNTAAAAATAKSLRSLKSPGAQSLLDQLAAKDPHLAPMLAGMALHPWSAGGARTALESVLATPLAFMGHPGLAVGQFAASSPRLAGAIQYGAGRAEGAIRSPMGQHMRQLGYYGDLANEGASTDSPQTDPSAPPSVRNNNMGNIKDGDFAKSQPGYVGSDGTFAKFATPAHGEAAAAALLEHKLRSGLDTPAALINTPGKGWDAAAPASYAQHVAHFLGIGVNDPIDINRPGVKARLLEAIKRFEGGPNASASGGRIERASGGRAGRSHEQLVGRLMLAAKRAKKVEDSRTEPLLQAPDEAIVKALDVAKRAI